MPLYDMQKSIAHGCFNPAVIIVPGVVTDRAGYLAPIQGEQLLAAMAIRDGLYHAGQPMPAMVFQAAGHGSLQLEPDPLPAHLQLAAPRFGAPSYAERAQQFLTALDICDPDMAREDCIKGELALDTLMEALETILRMAGRWDLLLRLHKKLRDSLYAPTSAECNLAAKCQAYRETGEPVPVVLVGPDYNIARSVWYLKTYAELAGMPLNLRRITIPSKNWLQENHAEYVADIQKRLDKAIVDWQDLKHIIIAAADPLGALVDHVLTEHDCYNHGPFVMTVQSQPKGGVPAALDTTGTAEYYYRRVGALTP